MAQQIPHYAAAVLIAPIAGGSAFVAALGLVQLSKGFPKALQVTSRDLTEFLMFLPISLIPGWFFAVLPCVIGAGLMAHLGSKLIWSRNPLVWALAGLLPTLLASTMINGLVPDAGEAIFAFGIPSIICALICRRFTRWDDAAGLVGPVKPAVLPAVAV